MSESIEEHIAALAAGQQGVVTRRQLLSAGLTSRQVEGRLKAKRLRRVHRGVYVLGHLRGPLHPPYAFEMAAVLACGPGTLVSHVHAAGLWDLASRPPRSRPVHVLVADRTPTRRSGIVAHRAADLLPGDADNVDGIPVTSPVRTLADLAGLVTMRELERALARAERLGLIDGGALPELVARQRGRRGARLLRTVICREGGPAFTRSEAESRFLELVRDTGLDQPAANVVVHGYELDFYWPDLEIAVEVDGFAYHGSRRSFRADRRRDAHLFSVAGIRVLRFTWEQIVHQPKATLVTLTRALDRGAGVDHGARHPPHPRRSPRGWPGSGRRS